MDEVREMIPNVMLVHHAFGGKLTSKQCEALYWVSCGLGNNEVAHKMKINEKSVKFHLTSIYKKLDCVSRVQAAVKTIALIGIPEDAKQQEFMKGI